MEISGKQTTKSSDSRRKEINKVIWYTVARKQQSHMISGGKSTKSFDMCLKSMTLFLLAPHPTFRRPPKRPIAANKRTLDVATRRIQICNIHKFSLHITSSYKSSFRFRRETKSIHSPVKDTLRTNAILNSLIFNHFECSFINQTVNLALYCIQKLHAILCTLFSPRFISA